MLEILSPAENKTTLERTTPSLLPCSLDLATCFHKFVKYWAGADVDYLGYAAEGPLEMPVEVTIRWKGSVSGTLVIRCYQGFLDWLKDSRDYKPLYLCTEKEIFNEMNTLYCIHLIQSFWLTEIYQLGPIVPRPSTPESWPVREPDATCGLLVEQNPVEIRLWVEEPV